MEREQWSVSLEWLTSLPSIHTFWVLSDLAGIQEEKIHQNQ